MELTRRDAVAALAAAGVVGGGAAALAFEDGNRSDGEQASDGAGPIGAEEMDVMVAAAETLYPSDVESVRSFVERYARTKARERPDHAAGVADAAGYLDEYSQSWFEEPFAALDPEARGEALRRMGADAADPDPDGSDVERVRYYVVNELLFALYTTPTGGELVGIVNPQGHPGGTESYQRGPGA